MPLPSIGTRLYQLVVLMCLLVGLAISMLVLKRVDSHIQERTQEALRLDKALSSLDADEEAALRGETLAMPSGHLRVSENFKGQLTPEVEQMLATRGAVFDQLLTLTRRMEDEHTRVFSKLLDITDAIRYIHQHHAAYLQNLVNREAISVASPSDRDSRRRLNESANTELSIIRESLNIYTSLFDIHAVFFKLQQAGPEGVGELFHKHMARFNASISSFEDYSLDAQDGLLIEELLLTGKNFEQSFSGLVEMARERVRLLRQLAESKAALNVTTLKFLAEQDAEVRKAQLRSDILQTTFIAVIMVFAVLFIAYCSQLSKAVKRIASEAHMLQKDLGHRVDADSAWFDEFQAVFITFNTMAGTLGSQMGQLTSLAFNDTLTGLPNRTHLLHRLEIAIIASRKNPDYFFAVVFLDLDRFKIINDSLGHECGDEVLKTFGRTLGECVRDGDTVARLGGDEFAILLENLRTRREVIQVVKRIRARISKRISVSGFGLIVQASIGISINPKGQKPEDILRDADIAMYDAKKKGAGKFKVYTPRLGEQALRVLNMELDLRQAIERLEIEVYFQPIMELETGRLHGFEALARWRHPDHGAIPPSKFIPLAEETGLILPLGRLVLARACGYAARWNRALGPGQSLIVHVNLSPKQFCNAGLVQEVARELNANGLAAHLLNLEITETMLMASTINALSIMNRLKDLGVGLSLDDFGTGYSSLGNLRDFPVDTFKIDRSFITRLCHDKKTEDMVQLVLAMSRTLGKEVVAEGVENAGQVALLLSLGCRLVQGFYFSRPLSPQDMDAFIEFGVPQLQMA
ncbi:putative bifunctional diguanylate cyclase/phosphodiesterase [Fundidesulfovibrio soli]|uniref:putative bifunctional diguanylate cyclase/phosphodiesterase n=1 Tax=Fundidesulfovibrio soli TaxID=2922716 RepID=UPI001FAFCC8C|nr:bifunctional diguanylate cyclase/phosphodiesterase [Fundidesulfovibrio soli]